MNAPRELATAIGSDGFAAELARLDAAIDREIYRLRARYELSLDEQRGLYISDEQVEALLQQQVPQYTPHAIPEPPAIDVGSRWHRLRETLALSRVDMDLILLALAPELNAKYEALFAYLNNDVSRKLPTLELAQRLFGTTPEASTALRSRLLPNQPLCLYGVIEFAAATRDASRWLRGLRLPAALIDWLLGLDFDDERLIGLARLIEVEPSSEPPAGIGDIAALAAISNGPNGSILVFAAANASEAAWAARHAMSSIAPCGAVLTVDLLALRAAAVPNEIVNALLLQQALLGVGIVVAPLDALLDLDSRPLEVPSAALRRLTQRARPIAVATSQSVRWRDLLPHVRTFHVQLRELDAPARARVWLSALGQATSAQLGVTELRGLADRFALSAERIAAAAGYATDLARVAGTPVDIAHLYGAARAASSEGSTGVTRSVPTQFAWDDLIVPTDVRQRLLDVVRAVELRPQVFDHWGFERRAGGARGIKVMFAGASGTGKTMAAAIVARSLGLDLHRIELAAVMSKYIGETEKNLERAFVAARRCNAILFIDEADALLGKRSEVKDAHDRYANVEIAYLLQRMEDHDGIVIVATNLAHNIDPAFARRMQYVVQFPVPDVASREQIWRSMFPPAAPLDDDVDLAFIARQFALAGGDIRNIVLDAAFRAAHDGGAIGMGHLLAAIAQQYVKRGKVPPTVEFGEYAHVLNGLADAGSELAVNET